MLGVMLTLPAMWSRIASSQRTCSSVKAQRASCMARCLFTDGMARKSKVSRLFVAGKRAALILRSTMRWWRSISSSSESLSR